MSEIVRDTVFGHLLRLATKGRVLQYAEERDATLWKQYIDRDQTKNMALYGNPEGVAAEEYQKEQVAGGPSEDSSSTQSANAGQREHGQLSSTITGQRIDTEKGRDTAMVTWYGDDDPEVGVFGGYVEVNKGLTV